MTEPRGDGRLLQLLDERLPAEWTPAELAWLRGRVRASPQVREAVVRRVRLEQALAEACGAAPFVPAQLASRIVQDAAALSPAAAAPLAAYWGWGLGLSMLVAIVSLAWLWPSGPEGDAGNRPVPAAVSGPEAGEPLLPALEAPPARRAEPMQSPLEAPPAGEISRPSDLVPPGLDDGGSPSDRVPAGFVD